jgi:hypothetical protein
MGLKRWDVLVVAAVAAASAAVFAGFGPRPAWADAADPAELVAKALDKAQKFELAGCRLSACPAEARYTAGGEQQVVLRATNPGTSPAALSLTIVAENVQFTMSRAPRPMKVGDVERAECQLVLIVEPGKTAEGRAAFKLPAGNYSISAHTSQKGAVTGVVLCSLQVMPAVAAKPAPAAPVAAAARQTL